MLRLLATLLSLAAAPLGVTLSSPEPPPAHEGHAAHDSIVVTPYVEPERHELVLDASAMPGETGWFLVPLTAASPVGVEIEAKYRQAYDAATQQAAVVIIAEDGRAQAMGSQSYAWRDAEVNVRGRQVACCQEVTARYPWNDDSYNGGSTGGGAYLEAGETLWVGLVAAGWGEGSKMKITLVSYGAPLLPGPPVTGRTVEAVDLVDEARRAGTNARFAGQRLVGSDADVTREWSPAGTGLLLLDANAQGDAGARLSVALPHGAVHRGERLQDESLGMTAFERGGKISLRLADLREPGIQLAPGAQYSGIAVRALYADLSVPLVGYQAWHAPIEYEDDDW